LWVEPVFRQMGAARFAHAGFVKRTRAACKRSRDSTVGAHQFERHGVTFETAVVDALEGPREGKYEHTMAHGQSCQLIRHTDCCVPCYGRARRDYNGFRRASLIVTTPRHNSQRSQRKVAFYDSDGELMTISDEVCPIRMFKRCLPVTRYVIRRDLSKDDIPPSPTYALAARRTVGQRVKRAQAIQTAAAH
jgi:hypothetical protein